MAEQKKKTAVAIGYEQGDEAPKILATGKGHVAERIIEEAAKADVPLHQDAKLAETLSGLDFGDYIPPELYEAVVEVLIYVDRVDSVRKKMEVPDGGSKKHEGSRK